MAKNFTWKVLRSHGKRIKCARGSIRTKRLRGGKLLRVCCAPGEWKPRAKRCKRSMRAYEIGTPKLKKR